MATIRVPGRFKHLLELRQFVGEAAEKAGLDSRGVYAVKLATDEACTNIIEHGYGGEGKGVIECTCETSAAGLTVIIRDWGQAFDPKSVPDLDPTLALEEVGSRGAGLFLIKNLMDEVDFVFSKAGNVLTLVKYK